MAPQSSENSQILPITTNANDASLNVTVGKLKSLSELQGTDVWGKTQVLEFKNLSYQVTKVTKNDKGKKEKVKTDILSKINGAARTGEVMAILGPSGAGKSTFLDAIAGRIRPDSLKGSVLLNGENAFTRIKKLSAYVQQDDELFPMLTVQETLMFSAGVRLPASVSLEEKSQRVFQLMQQLGLENAAGTIIGDADHRGISGGERRRVSIGVDIIHDPAILFLDEPTSGLDSSAAFSVMERLRGIAMAGSMVVCTIHQPSFRVLDLIDQMLVIAKGQVAYLGSPADLPHRLEEAGIHFPQHANSAEVIMDVLQPSFSQQDKTADIKSASSLSMAKLIEINERRWERDEEEGRGGEKAGLLEQVEKVPGTFPAEVYKPKFTNGFFSELSWLMWRATINIRRTPPLFIVRIINVIITSFLLASLFWRPNTGSQGAHNIISFTVFALCLVYFTSNDALSAFIQERLIFIRESSHYAYRTSSYVLANMFVFLPFLLLLATIFTLLCWWSVELYGGVSGFFFWVFVLFCAFFTANSFVSFLGAIVPNLVVGNTVALAVTAYYLLLSGFFIKRTEIPGYWLWIHYLSSLKWPYQALILQQFDHDVCYLNGESNGSDLSIPGSPNNTVCTLSGRDIVKDLAADELNKWVCCAILICLGVAYRLAFYATLRISSNKKRK